jgi:hypothetical protein
MASQEFRNLGRLASVTLLLPAFLTLNIALNAQNRSDASRLRQSLGLSGAKDAKSRANFNRMVAEHMVASNAATTATTASTALPKFIVHRDYVAADVPVNLAMGDLNGDGIADLVVPNFNSTNVSVLLGKRDGSFRPLQLFDSGGVNPFDAVVADFNGDGKNDVAVTIPSGGVSILLGDGLGHLGAPVVLPDGNHPLHIVAADFNGDHKLDLAVTDLNSNSVSLLFGRGDGTFTAATSPAVGMGPVGIVLGDFNGDGKADLAVANSGVLSGNNQGAHANTVAILLGTGTGRFLAPVFLPVAKTPLLLAVADFNKDGKQDVVVSNNGGRVVSELLGNGNGTFQTPRTFQVPQALAISVADFNTDGNPDLVVTNGDLSSISLLLGDGTGKFGPAIQVPSGRLPRAVLTGDFNHDGKADYITANVDPNTVSVVLGKGNGKFFDIGSAIPTKGKYSTQIIAADFNNDGIPDLAQVNTGVVGDLGNTISVLLGKNGGGFQAARTFNVGTQPAGLAAVDFNHDGRLDLVVADFGDPSNNIGGDIALLLGNGDGTFQAPRKFVAGPGGPISVAVGDFNSDGNPDAVVAQVSTARAPAAVSLLLGDGNNSFGEPKNIALFSLPGSQALQVIAADFNHDGKNDIAYRTITDLNRITVQLGNGDGTFKTPMVVTSAGFTTVFSTFSIGDFNNDGILDFAVEETPFIEVLLGNGNGTFTSKGGFLEGTADSFPFFPSLVLADFNGDGFLDVAALDGFAESVSLLLGSGDGTLRPTQLFAGGLIGSAVAVDVAGFQPSIALAAGSKVRIMKNATPSR